MPRKVSMINLGNDQYICPSCGYQTNRSWGDCNTPKCMICGGDPNYYTKLVKRVEQQADEIAELKKQLAIATNQIPPGIDPII